MWARRGMAVRTGRTDQFRELETRLLDPQTRSSRAALEELVHEDFVGLGSAGNVYRREAMIESISQQSDAGGVVIADLECHQVSDVTALVTYRSIGGRGTEVRRSSLWVEADERWQLFFHQGSRVPNTWGQIG